MRRVAAALIGLLGCAPSMRDARVPIDRLARDRLGASLPASLHADEEAPDVERLLASPLTRTAAVQVALLSQRHLRAALAELGIARAAFVDAVDLGPTEVELTYDAVGAWQ